MSDVSEFTKNRFIDLSRMTYERGVYTFTDFLTLAEQSDLFDCSSQLYAPFQTNGGFVSAERIMARFGSIDDLGYDQDYPISCLRIAPLNKKFAETLSHRDYLGSLMNIGIERPKFGDIIVDKDNSTAYVFVVDTLADHICRELTHVRHTSVMTTIVDDISDYPTPKLSERGLQVHSERIDAIIAKVFNLSRSQSADLFLQKKIFIDGRLMENESHILKSGSTVSVRGYGRFVYEGISGTTKKGNLNIMICSYE